MNRSRRPIPESPANPGFHGDGGNRTRALIPPWLISLIAAFALALCTPLATAGAVSTPPTGTYLACPTDTACQSHLDRLAGAGVSRFVMPAAGTYPDSQAIAAHVAALGRGIWWNVHGDTPNGRAFVLASKDWPATRGYYIFDEPAFHAIAPATVAGWDDWVHANSGKPTMIAHYGCGRAGVDAAALPYITLASMPGNDCYPLTDRDRNSREDAGLVYGGYRRLREIAGGRFAFSIAKAFSWRDIARECGPSQATCQADRYPSRTEMRTMRDCARKANMNVSLWWGYDVWKDWLTTNPAMYARRWADWIRGGLQGAYADTGACRP